MDLVPMSRLSYFQSELTGIRVGHNFIMLIKMCQWKKTGNPEIENYWQWAAKSQI